jgi:serine/threonine protein phosphatase PrpC
VTCSDGLTEELEDGRIARLLAAGAGAGADELAAAAVRTDGRDDLSAVVARPDFAGLAEPSADEQTLDRTLGTELEDTRPRRR